MGLTGDTTLPEPVTSEIARARARWCYHRGVIAGVVVEALHEPRVATTTAVFDFDGTLVSRDSFIDFALRYCAARPLRLLALAAVLPLAALMGLRSRQATASVLLWAMTVGTSARRFLQALSKYSKQVLPRYAHASVFAELSRQASAGSRVVIATGTLPVLVRGLLEARGLPRLPVAGSRLRGRWGGLLVETHCTGRVKLGQLERRFGVASWSAVYTDSFADAPLMSRASDITLVSPNRRTLRRTSGLLAHGATLRVMQPHQR